jgi:hypothetical protein
LGWWAAGRSAQWGAGSDVGGRWNNSLVKLVQSRVRFRYNASIAIAGFVAFLGAIPLATAGLSSPGADQPWYAYPLLLVFLIPIAVTVWGWRAGTDANAEGLAVRRFGLGSEPIAWSEIVGIVPQQRRVYAILSDDRAVPLPGVGRGDIPRLIAASGQNVVADSDEKPADNGQTPAEVDEPVQ